MVADYFPHNVPGKKRKDFSYGSERNQAYKAKRSKPVTKAKNEKFGTRNPDGSQYVAPPTKSKQVRPS